MFEVDDGRESEWVEEAGDNGVDAICAESVPLVCSASHLSGANAFSTPGMRESTTVLSLTPFLFSIFFIFSCSSSKSTKFLGASTCAADTEETTRGLVTWNGEYVDLGDVGERERGEEALRGLVRLDSKGERGEVAVTGGVVSRGELGDILECRRNRLPSSHPTNKLPLCSSSPSGTLIEICFCMMSVGVASERLLVTEAPPFDPKVRAKDVLITAVGCITLN